MTDVDAMELCKRALNGDDEALLDFLELQESGRGLRCYPMGRNGADDEGAVATVVMMDSESLSVRIGMTTIIVPIPRLKAIEVVKNVFDKYSGYPAESSGVRAFLHEQQIYLLMDREAKRFDFSPKQAVDLALKLRDVLLEQASTHGLDAIDNLLKSIGDLPE